MQRFSPSTMTPATFRFGRANRSVERDRLQAELAGSLRGFAATAAPHVKRYASGKHAK